MIWSHSSAVQPDRSSLESHLLEEIHALCGDSASIELATEVASGIAAYWEQVLFDKPLSSDYVAFLVSRAMRAVGADAAADAAMSGQSAAAFGGDLIDHLPVGEVSLQSWRMFTSLLVRPTRWTSYGDDVVWVFDFSRLHFDDNHCFELSLSESMRGVLLQLAEIWTQTDGQGSLGLKGTDSLRSVFGGRDAAVDIVSLCRDILRAEAEKRGWGSIPSVLLIDAPVGKAGTKKISSR